MTTAATEVPTYVQTPEAILSYPALFKPKVNAKTGLEKYEATFVFTPEAQKDPKFAALAAALQAAGMKKFGDRFHSLIKSEGFKKGLRFDGAEKYGPGTVYFSARSDTPPQVVGPDLKLITDPAKLYAGSIVRASVRAFGFDNESKGVAFALQNVQFIRDGKRLDGKKDAADEFEAIQVEPKDLSALDAMFGK